MAAGLLHARLVEDRIPAAVSSAGLLTDGQPASKHGVTAMRKRAVDIAEHRSQRMTAELVEAADLVLCMERKHVREATVLVPDAFGRTFTLPELVRRARSIGPRRSDESIGSWLTRAGAGRSQADLLASSPDDEVADPIGGSKREYARTADELEELVDDLVDHLFPPSI